MPRKPNRLTTTQRHLGHDHRQWATKLPNPNGRPCPRCGQPMLPGQKLDLGHTIDRARGGGNSPRRWEHAHCNRKAGAKLMHTLAGHTTTTTTARHSRQW